MPTYEYLCEKVRKTFRKGSTDVCQVFSDLPEGFMPADALGKGKSQTRYQRRSGLIFKGSGFYITDYRSEKYKEAAKKEARPPLLPEATQRPQAVRPQLGLLSARRGRPWVRRLRSLSRFRKQRRRASFLAASLYFSLR